MEQRRRKGLSRKGGRDGAEKEVVMEQRRK